MSENTIGFRSAFHGFNREDVVQFLEKLNTEHGAEVSQLKDDAKRLEAQLQAANFENERLQKEVSRLQEERDALAAQLEELQTAQSSAEESREVCFEEAPVEPATEEVPAVESAVVEETPAVAEPVVQESEELLALRARCQALENELEALKMQQTPVTQNWSEAELAAYRRAEAVERQAKARSLQICAQAEALIADLTARLAADQEALQKASQVVSVGLDDLQTALTSGQETLREGEATLRTLRPTEEI